MSQTQSEPGSLQNASLQMVAAFLGDELEPEGEICSECGAEVDSIIGCPGGEELCRDCFNAGCP